MSGVTPILDTLLHQVLGRRADFLRRPLLEQPIPPPQSGQPSQKAYSDSRLNARPTTASLRSTVVTGAKVRVAESALRQASAQALHADPAASSRLSRTARTIADLLARFPSPPEALRPAAPLLASGAPLHVAVLSAMLRQSVEHSGLFYESHLRRWHQGKYPASRLLQEPQGRQPPGPAGQLWAALVGDSASEAGRGGGPAGQTTPSQAPPHTGAHAAGPNPATVTANPQGLSTLLTYGADGKPLVPLGPPLANAPAGSDPASADKPLAWMATHGQTGAPHGLETTVRHQLEMLAVPVLRWEGQPWAGLFMAMTLQPPLRQVPWQGSSKGEDRKREDEHGWSSEITLRLARLGEVRVGLRLDERRVALDLQASPQTAARLDAGIQRLHERLGALGFEHVSLHVHASPEKGDGDA